MKRTIVAAAFVLVLFALLSPMVTFGDAQAKDQQATPMALSGGDPVDHFTIIVSSLGFNGTSGNLNITVAQGDTVRITFIYGDACPATLQLPGCDNLPFDNPHQLEVEGYQVTSAVIDTENNESTVQFIAGTTGSFQIHCIIPCEGMDNMQNLWLAVVEPGSTTSSTASSSSTSTSATTTSSTTSSTAPSSSTSTSATTSSTASSTSTSTSTSTTTSAVTSVTSTTTKSKTSTALEAPSLEVAQGGLNISVILVTSSGTPIAGVPVVFYAQTDFGNSTLGKNFTGANGWAYLAYPTVPTGWTGVFASFAGNAEYSASSVAFQTTALPAPPAPNSISPYISLNVQQPDLRLIGVPPAEGALIVGVFFLVLACVYLVILVVLAQGLRGHWN